MNTTNLVVELIIVGVGASVSLILFGLAALGLPWAALAGASELWVLLVALAFTYVVGILVDRAADLLLGRLFTGRIRRQYFDGDQDYHDARRRIVLRSGPLYAIRQYGRSRIRICRGWALNSLLLCASGLTFLASRGAAPRPMLVLGVGCAGLFVGCVLAWRALLHSEYLKLQRDSDFILREASRDEGDAVVPVTPAP